MLEATVTINEGVDSLDDHVSQLLSENSTRQFPHFTWISSAFCVCENETQRRRDGTRLFLPINSSPKASPAQHSISI